ncbi:MAG: ChaN family lipoprotein [Leptolyngbyaceae cyanobacterium CSU_1_4]|nr:ChaN family lipoprotein [Leptolyngbyaceae cyanobacterium CSU_1_4]
MKTSIQLWAGAIACLLFWSPSVSAQTVFECGNAEVLDRQAFVAQQVIVTDLAQARVVYLGETHDDLADHQGQLEIIRALYQQKQQHQHNQQQHQQHQSKGLAIALEMFQRPAQPLLDQYLAGKITELELRQQSEYDSRWGFSWEYYAPILQFAKAHQLPLIALNVPTEITRQVARSGLESLTATDRQWIPPDSEIRTDNAAYRPMIRAVYEEIHSGSSISGSFDRFFLAQVLWDETMAQVIAALLQAQPNHQVVVLAGEGHLVYGHGIPSRVARRIEGIEQRSVLLNPDEEMKSEGVISLGHPLGIADYFWLSEACTP